MNIPDPKSIKRILVTRMKYIGDVVLTTPLLRSLREKYPDAFIAYLGDADAVSLLRHNPVLDEIIPFRGKEMTLAGDIRFIRELRQRRFDLVIDLFGNPRTALLSLLSGAPVRAGENRRIRGRLYTVRVTDDGTPKSAVAFHQQFLRALGISAEHSKTEIFLTGQEQDQAVRLLDELGISRGEKIVALHPGGTWPAKLWLPDRFASLARRIPLELRAHVLLTSGPGDKKILEQVRSTAGVEAIALPLLPLRGLAAVLAHVDLFVANDSGPMHIAAAVGTPTIGIFGPGEENIWFPYTEKYPCGSSKNCALRMNVPCHPCHLTVCSRKGSEEMECMKLLSVQHVFNAVKERLQ